MKIKTMLFSALLAFSVSGSAFAYTIAGGTDVGGIDSFLGKIENMNPSDPATEATWASGIVGTTLTFTGKSDPANFQVTVEDSGIVAFKLLTTPSYFLLKDARTHVLFKNEPNMDWGVFRLLDYFKDKEDLQLSHLTEFNGGTVTVPEPGTLGLLGLGILGLLTLRRKLQRTA
ncbi:PEP-CTERM sorting domain-containing protein [Marinobacter shengliensis]|uniref:PEP-CTERM sorting domain-containing protein n=1 Tax=Marinobacter shengliensis TaxID=1389223 RepID=A0ABV4W4F3_9GAMM|nr:PEP-CTERM sorting domain-containing protein [Marinobacter shengliensis]